MKNTLLAASAAILLASSNAYAADAVYYQDTTPTAAPAAYSWSGFYVGVNAGIGGGTAKHPFSVVDTAGTALLDGSLNVNGSGFVGGAQVGYNVDSGSVVWGVEGDIQYANINNRISASFADPTTPSSIIDLSAGTNLEWFGTIRARVGMPVTGRFLAYITGGAAYGETVSSITASMGGTSLGDVSARSGKWGWTVGAGGEYAVTDTMSIKTEYLYTDLGKANLITADLGGGVTGSLDRDYRFHTVRVGLNFKF